MTYYPSSILCVSPGSTNEFQAAVHNFTSATHSTKLIQFSWYNQELTEITIDDVRAFITELSYTPNPDAVRCMVVLAADQMNLAAQNAVLKSLEEPTKNTHCILVVTALNALLPTIQSRCHVVDLTPKQNAVQEEFIGVLEKLETGGIPAAISVAETYKKKEDATRCVHGLLNAMYATRIQANPAGQELLKQVQFCQKGFTILSYLQANSNPQMTLEHWFFSLHTQ